MKSRSLRPIPTPRKSLKQEILKVKSRFDKRRSVLMPTIEKSRFLEPVNNIFQGKY